MIPMRDLIETYRAALAVRWSGSDLHEAVRALVRRDLETWWEVTA